MSVATNVQLAGSRLGYVLGGNRSAPRAVSVKLYTAEGMKEMAVLPAPAPLGRMIETVLEVKPSRVEAYDKEGKLLRSLDMTTLEEDDGNTSETTTHVTREERLLSHFASLLADGRKSADDMMGKAFSKLAAIAEHHANRANALEMRNASLQNALVKQAGNLVAVQFQAAQAAADAKRAGEGSDEEADAAMAAYLKRILAGEAEKPPANGGTQ